MCHSLNLFFLSHLNYLLLCVFLEKSQLLLFIIQNAHLLFITASPVCFLGKKLYDVLSMTTIYYNIFIVWRLFSWIDNFSWVFFSTFLSFVYAHGVIKMFFVFIVDWLKLEKKPFRMRFDALIHLTIALGAV